MEYFCKRLTLTSQCRDRSIFLVFAQYVNFQSYCAIYEVNRPWFCLKAEEKDCLLAWVYVNAFISLTCAFRRVTNRACNRFPDIWKCPEHSTAIFSSRNEIYESLFFFRPTLQDDIIPLWVIEIYYNNVYFSPNNLFHYTKFKLNICLK